MPRTPKRKICQPSDEILATIDAALLLLPQTDKAVESAQKWINSFKPDGSPTKPIGLTPSQMMVILGRAKGTSTAVVAVKGKDEFAALVEASQGLSPQGVQFALSEMFRKAPQQKFFNHIDCIAAIEAAKQNNSKPKQQNFYIRSWVVQDGKELPVWNDGVIGNRQ